MTPPPPPSGNPALKGNASPKVEARFAQVETRLDGHDAHLARHDVELRELNRDIADLAAVVEKASEVARRAKLREQARASSTVKVSRRRG